MILINVRFTVRPEHADEWLHLTRDFTEATRSEEGNLWFDWYRSPSEPNVYLLCEAFQEGDAPERHANSRHFQDFTSSAGTWLQHTPEIINTTADGESWGPMSEITV